jgi:chemotaxis protein MotA
MEKSTPIGLVLGIGLIFGAIFIENGWQMFFHLPSFMLVIGGTTAAVFVGFSLADLKTIPRALKEFLGFSPINLQDYIQQFTEMSRTARREGLLALDRSLDEVENELMHFGLEMAVDGISADELEQMMRRRIAEGIRLRHLLSKFFNTAGSFAPAFGMVGTLIGLIQMMQVLDDPSQIGAGMAVAMITTFYGALLANLVLLPLAGKVKLQLQEDLKGCEMIREGVLGIVRGDSPMMLTKRLELFLGSDAKASPRSADVTPLAKAA